MASRFFTDKYLRLIAQSSIDVIKSEEYKKILKILLACYKRKGTVFTMGCGGSASNATHFAADLAKTTMSEGINGFKSIALVDNIPLVSAWTNDRGWASVFEGQLAPWLTKNDVLVGFSVHGGTNQGDEAGPWSQNLVRALEFAKKRKAKIIGFSGYDGGALKEMSDGCIVIPSKSETYGTALVESMHVVVFHELIFDLKERIKK